MFISDFTKLESDVGDNSLGNLYRNIIKVSIQCVFIVYSSTYLEASLPHKVQTWRDHPIVELCDQVVLILEMSW